MKILGINTATTSLSLALLDDEQILQERNVEGPTAKAEQLIPWIEEILAAQKLTIYDVEGIGVAQGPGAFTGLRIGVTTAKTLAQMLQIPLVGISTLQGYAYQFKTPAQDFELRIVLKACRGDMNTALFNIEAGKLFQIEEDKPIPADELWKIISQEDTALAGDIPELFAERILDQKPNAVGIAKLALCRISQKETHDPTLLVPQYSHGANIRLSPRLQVHLTKAAQETAAAADKGTPHTHS